jgi:hypothetical protein
MTSNSNYEIFVDELPDISNDDFYYDSYLIISDDDYFENLEIASGKPCNYCYGTGMDRLEEVDCMVCWGDGYL